MTTSLTRRKVLIVEDEPSIRKLLHALLAALGCDGEIADTGQQALALVNRSQFDAVLLDLRCSDLQAEELVPQIQIIRPSLIGRVLVITGEIADPETLDLIERYFLLQIPDHHLLQNVRGMLRALLGINPSPNHAA